MLLLDCTYNDPIFISYEHSANGRMRFYYDTRKMSTIYDLPYLKGTAHENNKDPEKHTLPHSLPFTPLFIKNNEDKNHLVGSCLGKAETDIFLCTADLSIYVVSLLNVLSGNSY